MFKLIIKKWKKSLKIKDELPYRHSYLSTRERLKGEDDEEEEREVRSSGTVVK